MYLLCIGAHPDDNEIKAGGLAALCRARGDSVRFVSVTDGSKGHYEKQYVADAELLARRRYDEARRAAAVIGAEYATMGLPDGEVFVTPANTEEMIRLLRNFGPAGAGPDVVILNRPNDYHRDHRYTAQLVLDASYMLTVPGICPDTPFLRSMPLFLYWQDRFTEGGTFREDIRVAIDSVLEQKVSMVAAHESQVFEWLPFNDGTLDKVPTDPAARRAFVEAYWVRRECLSPAAGLEGTAPRVGRVTESFQICEYGRQPSLEELHALLPTEAVVAGAGGGEGTTFEDW